MGDQCTESQFAISIVPGAPDSVTGRVGKLMKVYEEAYNYPNNFAKLRFQMLKLLSSNLWPEIETLAANAKRKQVAVAYVSDDLRIKFKAGDMFITDASDERIASGNTSKRILVDAVKKNVKVYSLPNLHSKVFIFDDILVMGSTNISSSSRNRLYEAGIVTDDPELLISANNLLEKYKKGAQKIDKPFLKRINSIKVVNDGKNQSGISADVKPSLIDLMRSNNYLLDDFVISFYEAKTTLTEKIIKQSAKKKSVNLPPPNKWVWYENDFDKSLEKILDRFFVKGELKVISFEVEWSDKKINKFIDVDTDVQVFVNAIKIRHKLITNFILDKRPPFKFDKRKLLKELNNLLKNNDVAKKKLLDKWVLTSKEFASILGIE